MCPATQSVWAEIEEGALKLLRDVALPLVLYTRNYTGTLTNTDTQTSIQTCWRLNLQTVKCTTRVNVSACGGKKENLGNVKIERLKVKQEGQPSALPVVTGVEKNPTLTNWDADKTISGMYYFNESNIHYMLAGQCIIVPQCVCVWAWVCMLPVECEHEGEMLRCAGKLQNTGEWSHDQTRAGTTLGFREEELRGGREAS